MTRHRRTLAAIVASAALVSAGSAVIAGARAGDPTHFDAERANLEAALADATRPEAIALLNQKLELVSRDQEAERASRIMEQSPDRPAQLARANAAGEAAQRFYDSQPEVRAPVTAAGDGVLSDYARPVDGRQDFVSTNAWVRELDATDDVLIVYAGVSVVDRAMGVVRVYRQQPYGGRAELLAEASAPGAGRLRVVTATASLLSIAGASGGFWTFDAEAMRWASPLTR